MDKWQIALSIEVIQWYELMDHIDELEDYILSLKQQS